MKYLDTICRLFQFPLLKSYERKFVYAGLILTCARLTLIAFPAIGKPWEFMLSIGLGVWGLIGFGIVVANGQRKRRQYYSGDKYAIFYSDTQEVKHLALANYSTALVVASILVNKVRLSVSLLSILCILVVSLYIREEVARLNHVANKL